MPQYKRDKCFGAAGVRYRKDRCLVKKTLLVQRVYVRQNLVPWRYIFTTVVERQMFGIAEQTSGRCSVQWRQMFDTADVKQMFGADEADVWYIRHV